MHPGYLKARLNDVRACEGSGAASTARESKSAILGALADLGLPENSYVRDPSRPRSALYLYRDDDGLHELGAAPWRLVRHAPPDMPPEDVRRVGRELFRGLIGTVSGTALACLAALFTFLLSRAYATEVSTTSLSPAAYLHAAPTIFGCVAVLCAVAALWHLCSRSSSRAGLWRTTLRAGPRSDARWLGGATVEPPPRTSFRAPLAGRAARGRPRGPNGPAPKPDKGRVTPVDTEHRKTHALDLTENAVAVLKKRYLIKNEEGEAIEEPLDMYRRVAGSIAEPEVDFGLARGLSGDEARAVFEEQEERFLELMTSRRFMPNSPTLMNAGRELGQLSACFVLPVPDDLAGIYETAKHQALIHKAAGGTGFDFSRLRPKGDVVKSTMGVSSGPVSFMSVYDHSTKHVSQGGQRRGANMGILRVDHPDVEEFIECKRENDQINNFNISVAITDEFMEAVEADSDFELKNPRDGEVIKTVRAKDLFHKIVEGAWLNGEPGVVFIDKINADNPTPRFPIEATNPCSEAHLPAYDSCNLGSINLERFVLAAEEAERNIAHNGNGSGPRAPKETACVDWVALKDCVRTAVRFLDNVIEQNNHPLPKIEQMSKGNRRIGLGVMGFADALVKLGVPYDSERALELAESIMEYVDRHAWEASRELAEERGVFANWEGSTHQARGDRVRNATVTTIAPTGTISMIAGCSGGIEPLFAVAFMRRQADMEMPDVNPELVRRIEGYFGGTLGGAGQKMLSNIAREGTLAPFSDDELLGPLGAVFRTAGEISPEWHVKMQAAFQKHTSMGISKTINLPHQASVEDVGEAYRLAYDTGCKAIAVYRDGSREQQVLSTGSSPTRGTGTKEEPPATVVAPPLTEARNGRPNALSGVTRKLTTGHGPMYVSMNDDEFGPRECFVILGKPGGTAAAFSDALGRMISLALTRGAAPGEVVKQLRGIQDGHPAGVGPNAVLSVPDGVAKAMSEHYLSADAEANESQPELPIAGACPECGGELRRESGCDLCTTGGCGYQRCS